MLALVIGTLLAVGALAFVLYPVFFPADQSASRAVIRPRESERDAAVSALREIEFDRVTGKLSDADYTDLKARYTEQALAGHASGGRRCCRRRGAGTNER